MAWEIVTRFLTEEPAASLAAKMDMVGDFIDSLRETADAFERLKSLNFPVRIGKAIVWRELSKTSGRFVVLQSEGVLPSSIGCRGTKDRCHAYLGEMVVKMGNRFDPRMFRIEEDKEELKTGEYVG